MDRSDQFHRELDRLERHLPGWARGPFQRARTPGAAWVRALVATLLIIGGVLGIVLPALGFWMVPLGLALLAIDLPFIRGPFTRLLAFINRKLTSQAG
jgi:fatty acid desaturase